jgi:CRP-like cAMP-binding protein
MAEVHVIGPEDRRFATSTSLFNRLNGRSSDQLLRHASVRGYSKGEFVFRSGESPEFVNVVLKGCVALTGQTDEGRNTVIEFLEPGETFPIAAVALDRPYLLSARAATEIRLLQIPADRIRSMIQSNHDFSVTMVEILSHHWRLLATGLSPHHGKGRVLERGAAAERAPARSRAARDDPGEPLARLRPAAAARGARPRPDRHDQGRQAPALLLRRARHRVTRPVIGVQKPPMRI